MRLDENHGGDGSGAAVSRVQDQGCAVQMGQQVEAQHPEMHSEQVDVFAEDGSVGSVFQLIRVSQRSGKLEIADAEVLPEGIHQIVHYLVGQRRVCRKDDHRRGVFPAADGLDPQPSYGSAPAAEGVRNQSPVARGVPLREEPTQAQRNKSPAAAAADPHGLSPGQMGRDPHRAVETAGGASETHRAHIDAFPSFCQTP